MATVTTVDNLGYYSYLLVSAQIGDWMECHTFWQRFYKQAPPKRLQKIKQMYERPLR